MKWEDMTLNKSELITAMAKRANLTKSESERALDAFLNTLGETLQKGDKLQLVGYGTFEVRERAQRTGHNPQTGEEIVIPAARVPAFKPGAIVKEMVK